MGFFNLEDVVRAHRAGILDSFLASYSVNDLAMLKHEILGCAEKEDLIGDLAVLVEDLEELIDRRSAAGHKKGRRTEDKEE
jgi:hypothetical protein